MSDTPETDEVRFSGFEEGNPGFEVVSSEFARKLERQRNETLDVVEAIARQQCHTNKVENDYNGQVAGTLVTDSGAMSDHAEALELLAKYFRFRIVAGGGRMVVGYWPENDPLNPVKKAAP
jgi:hypothetical protein